MNDKTTMIDNDLNDGIRIVQSQLMHWNGMPVFVTGEVNSHPANWPLIDVGVQSEPVTA